jgi:hypothetical protein
MTWTARPVPADSTNDRYSHWIDDENGTPIADVRALPNGQGEKNAALIAAAPEMREAIAALVDALVPIADGLLPFSNTTMLRAVKIVRAAWKKLEGE